MTNNCYGMAATEYLIVVTVCRLEEVLRGVQPLQTQVMREMRVW